MTTSKVKRETRATIRDGGRERQIIVTIYPDGTLGFRLKRTRREYCLSAAACYQRAVAQAVAADKPKRRRRTVSRSMIR
jgi:hypothetical protein